MGTPCFLWGAVIGAALSFVSFFVAYMDVGKGREQDAEALLLTKKVTRPWVRLPTTTNAKKQIATQKNCSQRQKNIAIKKPLSRLLLILTH